MVRSATKSILEFAKHPLCAKQAHYYFYNNISLCGYKHAYKRIPQKI